MPTLLRPRRPLKLAVLVDQCHLLRRRETIQFEAGLFIAPAGNRAIASSEVQEVVR